MKKVVSREVLGSSNPIARKFRDVKQAFAGIFGGLIAIVISFFLIYASVFSVEENSKLIANLEPVEIGVDSENGMIKSTGNPELIDGAVLNYKSCSDLKCEDFFTTEETLRADLYVEGVFERFEVVKEVKTETRTVTENGQDIRETTEETVYEEQWVEKDRVEDFGLISLNGVEINPTDARLIIENQSEIIGKVEVPGETETYNQPNLSSQVGNTRLTATTTDLPETLTVVGDLSDGKIESGEPFIITDLTAEELAVQLEEEEAATRFGMRLFAWILLTIGIGALLAPILEFVEMIPLFGRMAKTAAGILGAISAALIVVSATLILQYWYIFLILFVLLIGGGIYLLIRQMGKAKGEKG